MATGLACLPRPPTADPQPALFSVIPYPAPLRSFQFFSSVICSLAAFRHQGNHASKDGARVNDL
eukprot:6195285-Pyramimonas_sp.AAC.1